MSKAKRPIRHTIVTSETKYLSYNYIMAALTTKFGNGVNIKPELVRDRAVLL